MLQARRRPDDAQPPRRGRMTSTAGSGCSGSTPRCRCGRRRTSRSCSPPARPTGGCRELRRLFEGLVGAGDARRHLLARWRGTVAELAAELDAYGLPATIDHSDLHAGNVLAPGDRLRLLRLARGRRHAPVLQHGGGDAVARAQPRRRAGRRRRPAAARRLPRAVERVRLARALRAALDLALRMGPLTRALGWMRVLGGCPRAAAGEWAESVVRLAARPRDGARPPVSPGRSPRSRRRRPRRWRAGTTRASTPSTTPTDPGGPGRAPRPGAARRPVPLGPERRRGLEGFAQLKPAAGGAAEIGLGLRPDLTGRGLGQPFTAQ